MAEWIAAGSLLVIALCAVAYVSLRMSDELRFRRAVTGVERQADEGGQIILPKRVRASDGRRKPDYKRRKAQDWINNRIREAGDG